MASRGSNHPTGSSSRPLLFNGVLIFCVFVLAVVVVWQNWPRRAPEGDRFREKGPPLEAERAEPAIRDATPIEPMPPPAAEQPQSPTPASPPAGENPSVVAPAPSEPPTLPAAASRGLSEEEKETIQLFVKASPSVVYITTHTLERDFFSLNNTEVPEGTGTGFVWDAAGHIVTNFHVIEGANGAQVALADHSTWPAELVGVAPDKDLAVVKIDAPANRIHPLPIGTSQDLQVGQKTFAIGNPFGLDHTLTTGIISALGREIESQTDRPIKGVIQTDAAINPGNSGGPLLDSSGRLVGMTTAIVSPSGAYAGIGFATPVDTIRWVVPELIANGKIIRPTLAVTAAPDALAERLGVSGVLILEVEHNSTAAQAGLRPTRRDAQGKVTRGDIIVQVDGAPIHSTNDLLEVFERHRAGDQVTLTVIRDGKEEKMPVRLEAPK